MFFPIFILFYIIIPLSLSCYPAHMMDKFPHHSKSEFFSLDDEESHKNYLECNFTLISPKKIINPYRSQIENHVPQKPFGSFYQRCAACVAVAMQIGNVINRVAKDTGTIYKNQSSINADIAKNIESLCSNGFRNYDLRRYDNVNLVTDNFKCTKHVNTNMDGNWTKKLRELCSLYTSHMDLEHVSNNYADKTEELVPNLCKGTGIFRDCLNVEKDLPTESIEDLNRCFPNCTCIIYEE